MNEPLAQLERQLELLIEGSLARLLGAELSSSDVAAQLARSMHDGVRTDAQGLPHAPDQYALTLHPTDIEVLLERGENLQADMAKGVMEAARSSGYRLGREPHITLAVDPTLPRWQVRVIAWHSSNPLEFTQAMPQSSDTQPGRLPIGAFLIIDGKRHFPLDRPVVNVGRRLDNQLILEDAHVSRTHAQLRVRDGRFVLFDLGSTAGTRVNGRPIKQHVLQAGDVISIASARLVYGEDPGGPPEATPAYRPPFPPKPAGDQRTRAGNWDEDLD